MSAFHFIDLGKLDAAGTNPYSTDHSNIVASEFWMSRDGAGTQSHLSLVFPKGTGKIYIFDTNVRRIAEKVSASGSGERINDEKFLEDVQSKVTTFVEKKLLPYGQTINPPITEWWFGDEDAGRQLRTLAGFQPQPTDLVKR